jgi:hypothetical protein
MSEINWLKAALKGRLGNVVGSSWRGKDYTKLYTPPTNRNTTAQKGVRSVFAHVGHIAHKIYKGVLEPYTYPVPRELTKYNLMMQINDELYKDKVWAPPKLKIFAGELKTVPIESADYKEADNQLDVEWGVAQSDDAADDAIILVYYEATGETLYAIAKRGDVNTILDTTLLGAALDVTKLHVYLAFSQPPGEKYEHGQVSNTAYKQARSV